MLPPVPFINLSLEVIQGLTFDISAIVNSDRIPVFPVWGKVASQRQAIAKELYPLNADTSVFLD
jgi:hypothetical protein